MKKFLVLIVMLTFFAVSSGSMAIADDGPGDGPASNSGGGGRRWRT